MAGTLKKPFEGLRVADFAWVGVGPLVSKYLADHGATGAATVAGLQVEVDVTITEPTKALGVVGINTFTVTGHGVAYLVYAQ